MRILFLTQILPYPPNAGPRVKTWYVLKHLAHSGHEITLLTYLRSDEEIFLPYVAEICKQVYPVPIRRSRILDIFFGLKSLLAGRSFLVERDNLPAMRKKLREIILNEEFDVIHADQLGMAQFAWQAKTLLAKRKTSPLPRLIFDAHNAVWTIVERMTSQLPRLAKPLINLEKRKIKTYEGWLLDHFDQTLAVSAIDRQALLAAAHADSAQKVSVIPIAVDTAQLAPVSPSAPSYRLLTIGTLHYPPNADGIRWFIKEVFPHVLAEIPQAALTIIGKNPPRDFYELAAVYPSSIHITGYVNDLQPFLQAADVLVVPVLAGGGMRVRILEGFARRLAIVTTSIGLEGIEAEIGRDVVVKDDAPGFARAVVQLLQDPVQCSYIAASGRALVEKKYDWKVVFRKLDQVYQSLPAQGFN